MSISWTELHLSQTKFMVLMIYQLLFKIFKTILPSNAKRKYMYEKTFIVYRCKKKIRQLELKKLRGKNAKIILLSGMNFITSSQCMCTHPTEQTNETHKKAFTLFHLPSWMSLFVYLLPFKNFIQYPLRSFAISVLNWNIWRWSCPKC